ncbi:MAG: hypothetical protein ACRCX8_17710, partial [Sarcina sp.]
MRKIRSLVLLFIILGLSTLGKSISIKGFGDLLNLVKTISKTQTGMNTELLDQGIKQAKQIENEINMIKNQVENLK